MVSLAFKLPFSDWSEQLVEITFIFLSSYWFKIGFIIIDFRFDLKLYFSFYFLKSIAVWEMEVRNVKFDNSFG
jgi:hypothetical protein